MSTRFAWWKLFRGPRWFRWAMTVELVTIGFAASWLISLLEARAGMVGSHEDIQIAIWLADATLVALAIPFFGLVTQLVRGGRESGLPESEVFFDRAHLSETFIGATGLFLVMGEGVVFFHGMGVVVVDFLALGMTLGLGASLYSKLLGVMGEPDSYREEALGELAGVLKEAVKIAQDGDGDGSVIAKAQRWYHDLAQYSVGVVPTRLGADFAKCLSYYERLVESVSVDVKEPLANEPGKRGWLRRDYRTFMGEAIADGAERSAHLVAVSWRCLVLSHFESDNQIGAKEMCGLGEDIWELALGGGAKECDAVATEIAGAIRDITGRLRRDTGGGKPWEWELLAGFIGQALKFATDATNYKGFEKVYLGAHRGMAGSWVGPEEHTDDSRYWRNAEKYIGASLYVVEGYLDLREGIEDDASVTLMRRACHTNRRGDTWITLEALCDTDLARRIGWDEWSTGVKESSGISFAPRVLERARVCALGSFLDQSPVEPPHGDRSRLRCLDGLLEREVIVAGAGKNMVWTKLAESRLNTVRAWFYDE